MGTRFSTPVQTGPGAHPASCTMGTGSLPGVKSDRGVTLTPHLLLVPWSWKSRAIPLLPFWFFVVCSRENFSFVSGRTDTSTLRKQFFRHNLKTAANNCLPYNSSFMCVPVGRATVSARGPISVSPSASWVFIGWSIRGLALPRGAQCVILWGLTLFVNLGSVTFPIHIVFFTSLQNIGIRIARSA